MNVPIKFLSLFVFALFCKITFSESLPNATSIIKKVNDAEDGIQVTRKVTMKMIDRRGRKEPEKPLVIENILVKIGRL